MKLNNIRIFPSTLRGQMIVVILAAVVLVIVMGKVAELFRNHLGITDADAPFQRGTTIALLMQNAPSESWPDLVRWSTGAGVPIEVVSIDDVAKRTSARDSYPSLGWFVRNLFPRDQALPLNGRVITFDGQRVLAFDLDRKRALVFKAFPDTLVTSDLIAPLTYYVLSFATLLFLFSMYAARALTEPLASITAKLKHAKADQLEPVFAERGTVEMVDLAHALNEMRARIRKMLETRTRMLRGVSHDLRTPLTRVRLRVERLSDVRNAPILTDLDHIDALIQETLDYMRDVSLAEQVERTDIASLVQTICDEYADLGHNVLYQGPGKLIGNCKSLALTRAITNLCDNGVKFATNVEIRLSKSSSAIVIAVCDDGPGIAEELRHLVIEPFYKVDPARGSSPNHKGFGLGLSIVAEVVESHKGVLQLIENVPRGLIARIEIPGP